MRFVPAALLAALALTAGGARADAPPAPAASASPPAVEAAGAPSATDPQAIFNAARAAWNFSAYPRYANYTVGVRYKNGSRTIARHWDSLEDLRRDIVFAQTFSREETANPTTPTGTNIGMLGMTLNVDQGDDPIGPLALAITYDFGISLSPSPRETQVAAMGSEVTAPSRKYQVIGRSGATAKVYDVKLIELLDGGNTYHLGLTPRLNPNGNRLREMWVSARTYITQKVLLSANFSKPPYTDVQWLVTFKQIGGGPYIDDEKALGPLDFGDGGTLTDVTISFDNLNSTSTLPKFGTVGINSDLVAPVDFVTEP